MSSVLASYSVGATLSAGDQATIHPANVDRGSSVYPTVYSGTLKSWNGRTGVLVADPTLGDASIPLQRTGEGILVRVHKDDCTYTPTQGDRVKFALVRTSAGDKVARVVSLIG